MSLFSPLTLLWRTIQHDLQQCTRDQRPFDENQPHGFDKETLWVLLTSCVVLTLQYYCVTSHHSRSFDEWLMGQLPDSVANVINDFQDQPENDELARLARWTLGNIFLYVVIPVFVIKCVLRRRLADFGAKLRGAFYGWQFYLAMLLVMLPFVYLASLRSTFQVYYPFYKLSMDEQLWPRFYIWEILYALQFVALEFYFRGFMVHGTKRALGPNSILVMTIPYCMIHFGKPMPETFGAIGAGVVLGYMSLRTRSIWLGAMLHICIAWTMDALAVQQHFS